MKLIKGLIKRFQSIIHLSFIGILHPNSISFHLEEMISNSVHFNINGSGKIKLGKKVGMRRGCEISVTDAGRITIGNECFFNNNCIITSHNEITIGEHTRFGPNVLIFDHDYCYKSKEPSERNSHVTQPIIIGKNVWIGAGTIILRGTVIGDNCVVGAGCVVKGTFENDTVIIQKRENVISNI